VADDVFAPRGRSDPRVHALMHALCLVALAPTGFRHRDLRDHIAQLQGRDPETYSSGSVTYEFAGSACSASSNEFPALRA
jgi:hypothetical protein